MVIENILGWCISIQSLKKDFRLKKKVFKSYENCKFVYSLYNWCIRLVQYYKPLFFLIEELIYACSSFL